MVVTVGFFDGVHVGHRRVLRALLEDGSPAAVVTFWPHPRIVLQRDARDLYLLTSEEEKFGHIRSLGINDIRRVTFTKEYASMQAAEFIKSELVDKMECTKLVLGYDNRLGSNGLGAADLTDICASMGVELVTVPPCIVDDIYVSSTCIRHEIAGGNVKLASKMLGYRYGFDGIVVPGCGMGRTLGFPTANIRPIVPNKIIPAQGVYATCITVDGSTYRSMTDIGCKPTFGSTDTIGVETNIFDFSDDIYGKSVRLEFISRIRDEKKFDSVEELKEQLKVDMYRSYGCN